MSWIVFLAMALVLNAILRTVVDVLNLRHAEGASVPEGFRDQVDPSKFRQSQEYLTAQTRFSIASRWVWLGISLIFLFLGGYGLVDEWARSFGLGAVATGVTYFFLLGALGEIVGIPFAWYHTFRLEERFGFNRSTARVFVLDHVKGWVLGLLIGAPILGAVLWFFASAGESAWILAWVFLAVMQILLAFIAPAVLMPLFNRFEPLPEGELRSEIERYAEQQKVRLKGIYTMDGSKRSSKANAFFTGFGNFRRIVLFDTLVAAHPTRELVAVLAHEVGHFKLGHIVKQIALSLVTSLLMFWVLSLVLRAEGLQAALGFRETSLHAGFTVAMLLYSPLSLVASVWGNALSRRYEYEADAFAARTTGEPEALAEALKRLSVSNLSNLTPHPWKVRLEYSHPPVTERVRVLCGDKG